MEQHRRIHGSVVLTDSDETDSSIHSESNTDSPYISDNELHTERKNHASGLLKLYLKERFSNWPKDHYEKYKQNHMKKHEGQLNYGNIHTKEIKYSLKHEKHQRKKEETSSTDLINTAVHSPKHTTSSPGNRLHPILPVEIDNTPISMINTTQKHTRSTAKLHHMKNKVKNSLKRTIQKTNNLATNITRTVITNDDSSETSDNE
jgi:hypothetical protein